VEETHETVQPGTTGEHSPHPSEVSGGSSHDSASSSSAGTAQRETSPPSFVYALGRVEPRFPSLAVEREFAQATSRGDTAELTDRQAFQAIISERSNRYLTRQLCWSFLVEGLETYILLPRDPADLDLLIEAVRSEPRREDLDVVIGTRGPIAPPEMCGGLSVPLVGFDQLYSFDRESLIGSLPRPESVPEEDDDRFRAAAAEVFDRIMQIADNAGATDEHRALNYLAVRYSAIYATAAEAHTRNASLTGVEVRRSRLSGVRNIVAVIFSYTHRQTDVTERFFVRVDVTEQFPFLITKLSPYYER
jgi:cyclic patellamide precursor peptide PatG